MSYLRKLWFHRCQTCANYDFAIVTLAPIVFLQLAPITCAKFDVVILAQIMILQLSYVRQLWFHSCQTCASDDFEIVMLAPIIIFQYVRFGPILILQKLYLRQLWFYNCQTCANYYFTIVTLAPITVLQLSNLSQLCFYNCHTCTKCDLQMLNLRQL